MYPFYQRCLLKLSLLFPGNTLETPLVTPLSLSAATIPWYKFTKKKGIIQRPCLQKGVRRLEMATDARSRDVQGHVVRTSILVAPGGATVRAAAEPTACLDAVASTTPRTPAPAQSPGSASPQPMDCDDNHPGPDDDAPGLHSTPVTKTCCRGPCTHDCHPQATMSLAMMMIVVLLFLQKQNLKKEWKMR